MRIATWLLAGALLLCFSGCRKPKPSPEYEEAAGAYSTVVARLGDDAYTDAEMTRIEGLLGRVPSNSLDAAAAKELLAKIASERKRAADEAAAQKKLLANANNPLNVPDSPRSPDEPVPVAAVDAGRHITLGMTMEEVTKLGDDCLAFTQNLRVRNVNGTEEDGVVWELHDLGKCRDEFPELVERMLVFERNKLEQIVEKSQLRHEVSDAGPAAAPAPAPAPKPEAQPSEPAPPAEPPTDAPPPIPSKLPPAVPPGENTAPAPTE